MSAEYAAIMALSDEALAIVRAWIRCVARAIRGRPSPVAVRVKRWRDKKRGGPPRPVTDWRSATHCSRGHPRNLVIGPKFRRECRDCLNERQRAYRRRKRSMLP